MGISLGSIFVEDIYIGSTPAKEIRLGSTLIWSRESEVKTYRLGVNTDAGSGDMAFQGRLLVNGIEQQMEMKSERLWEAQIPEYASVQLIYEEGRYDGPSVDITPHIPDWYGFEPFSMTQDYSIRVSADALYVLTVNVENEEAFSKNGINIEINGTTENIKQSTTFDVSDACTVKYYLPDNTDSWEYNATIYPQPDAWYEDGYWHMHTNYTITVTATPKSVYHTLTVNLASTAREHNWVDGVEVFIGDNYYRFSESKTFSVAHGESVRVINHCASSTYGYSFNTEIIPAITSSLDDGWIMDQDYIVNLYEVAKYFSLTVETESGVDSFYIHYKEPGYARDWVMVGHAGYLTDIQEGTEFYIEAYSEEGFVIDNYLRSKIDPFVLTEDTRITIDTAPVYQYELDISTNKQVRSITVQVGDESYTMYDTFGTDTPIYHDGKQPITVTVDTYGSVEGIEWSGNSAPTFSGAKTISWPYLHEHGKLDISISSS